MEPLPTSIGVLGLGNWGTALANYLARKGCRAVAWDRDASVVEGINAAHRNPRYQSDVTLDDKLIATTSLAEALNHRVLLNALPSKALDQIVPLMNPAPKILISAVKGFEHNRLLTPSQYITQTCGPDCKVVVLTGPSFARDVVLGRPCGVVAASHDSEAGDFVAELFAGSTLRVYTSDDPIGAEVGGAVKNVIALAAGVCDGLGLGESARAGIICRGLAEMMRLAAALGGKSQTLAGLSGLGDLAMTATSDLSRNRIVGLRLGRGEKLSYILDTLGSVAEGVETAPLVLKIAAQHGLELPITHYMVELINGTLSPAEVVAIMLARPIRREF